MELAEITQNDFLTVSMMYASERNIPGVDAYGRFGLGARCFAHPVLFERLMRLEHPLKKLGLKLKIFDAYRPPAAHEFMSARVPVKGLFAETAMLSQHCHASAVDVCLTDGAGNELEFPTRVDAYAPEYTQQLAKGITEPYFKHLQKADYACTDLPPEALKNRALLCSLMEDAGFERLQSEWWHFNLPEKEKYPMIDFRTDNEGNFHFTAV